MISVVTVLLVIVTNEMIKHSPFFGGTYNLSLLKLAITFFVICLISEIVIVTMTILFRKDIFGPIPKNK